MHLARMCCPEFYRRDIGSLLSFAACNFCAAQNWFGRTLVSLGVSLLSRLLVPTTKTASATPQPPGSSGGEGIVEDGASRQRAIDLAWGCARASEETFGFEKGRAARRPRGGRRPGRWWWRGRTGPDFRRWRGGS
jgi:hypothetical protein